MPATQNEVRDPHVLKHSTHEWLRQKQCQALTNCFVFTLGSESYLSSCPTYRWSQGMVLTSGMRAKMRDLIPKPGP